MKLLQSSLMLAVSLTFAGCATSDNHAPRPAGGGQGNGQAATPAVPAKDKVLYQYRDAVSDMRHGQFADAKRLLDDAISRIANIMGTDKDAKKARGYFNAEAKKTFIGEPYERVMAWYYRGILYWMDGEPDNARACFRSAMVEDSDTTNKTYAADYALLEYLDGLATAKLGDDGSEAYERAKSKAKFAQPPPLNTKENVLVFVDLGSGPTKFAAGEYHQYLMFHGGNSPARSARIRAVTSTSTNAANGSAKGQIVEATAPAFDDLYFQATTRGGRVMDHILANKAGFKRGTDVAGNVGIVGGAVMAQHRDTQAAGLGLLAFGLVSKLTSAATTPQADTRSWENLPLFLAFGALKLPPGQQTLTIEFLDAAQHPIPNLTKTVNLTVNPGKDAVVYVSDKSSTPLNL